MLLGNFFDTLLEKHVHVGHGERFCVGKIYLVLTATPLALTALDRHSRRGQMIANGPHEDLVPRGLQEMVIDPVIAGRHKIPITRGESGMISLVEKIEFQFACAEAGESLFFKQLKLSPQHRTRRLLDEGTILSDEITNHQRCARLPGKRANCLQIRAKGEIPKTRLPARDLKAIERIHFHVNSEQVVAAMGAMFQDRTQENLSSKALPNQSPKRIRNSNDNRIDPSRTDSCS